MYRLILTALIFCHTSHADIGSYQDRAHTPLLAIHELQGVVKDSDNAREHASPFKDRTIQVQGIVHQKLIWATRRGEARYGVLLQTAKTQQDKNPNTSEGLLFYAGREAAIPKKEGQFTPKVGDEIIVSGVIKERFGQTELGDVQLESLLRQGVNVDELVPAVNVNPPSDSAEALRYWERLEGMRVTVPTGVHVVSARKAHGATLDAMIEVVNPNHAITQRKNPYAQRVFRDPHPLDDQADKLFDNGNGYRYVLSSFGIKATEKDHRAVMPPAHTFDVLEGEQTGGVLFNWDSFKIAITQAPTVISKTEPADNNPPPIPEEASTLSIATYNVENLFDLRNDPDDGCDYPDDPGCHKVRQPFNYVPEKQTHYEARVIKIARHIIERLHAPDLLMLQEIEDQDMLGTKGNDALQDLASEIQKQGGPIYGVANDRRGADARGIICGFMYRTERISLMRPKRRHPVLGKMWKEPANLNPLPDNFNARNPKALNALHTWSERGKEKEEQIFSRAVQVAGFHVFKDKRGRGKPKSIYLLNNHFSSRPDKKITRRKQQATYNASIYKMLKKHDSKALVIMGGDLNVYPRPDDPLPENPSDQLASLYKAGMANLYDNLIKNTPEGAYSYVYHGQAQTLDHLFVGPLLNKAFQNIHALHVNSDYPYSTDAEDPYGASDHDPLVAQFRVW